MLKSHRKKFEILTAINRHLKEERLYTVFILEPISKLSRMLTLLIPIQLLIILNSDGLGRLGRFLPKSYMEDKPLLIAILCGILCLAFIISTASSFYSIRKASQLKKKIKSQRLLPIRAKFITLFFTAKCELYLITTIILLLLWLSPLMAALAALTSIAHMLILDKYQYWSKNVTRMILLTTPVISMIILFIALLLTTYFAEYSIIKCIVIFLLVRIFCGSIAKLDRVLLKIPERLIIRL